jgi:HAD superfamily phosphoserine phosphatase-like hydrolase
MQVNVYVDFDGTIAPDEPTDALFDRFADPAWREIESEWQQGIRSSRDCMSRQIELLRATPQDLDAFLSEVKIDPDFGEFVDLCYRSNMRVVVISDGLDRVVGSALRGAGISLPYYANRLKWLGGDRWKLEFPYARRECDFEMGNCKCSHRRAVPGSFDILVGDGRSDFCIAQRCELVLAKGTLASECRKSGINHQAIRNFADAVDVIAEWSQRTRLLQEQAV